MPMMPPAPVRFSITTGWPRDSCSFGAMRRAGMSVAPPGANGTMMVRRRLGQSCAMAAQATHCNTKNSSQRFINSPSAVDGQKDNKPMTAHRLRTGADFVSDLRNKPRNVYVDGERVTNVAEHRAFRGGARSIARLFDFAAAPENRDTMTFVPADGGGPAWRCWQIPRSHADLRAKRIAAEKWAELSFGLMGRTPDHVANFFA